MPDAMPDQPTLDFTTDARHPQPPRGTDPPDGKGPAPELEDEAATTARTGRRHAAKFPPNGSAPGAGVARAEAHKSPWSWWPARAALLQLATETAHTGGTFEAFDLTDRFGIEMDHPNRWGALIRAAATEGLIVQVGHVNSRRPSRAGGLVRTWRGTDAAQRASHVTGASHD